MYVNLGDQSNKLLNHKVTSGEEDEDGLEIWEDDPDACIEVERTECRVQEIPVPEDEEEAEEGTDDLSKEEGEDHDGDDDVGNVGGGIIFFDD